MNLVTFSVTIGFMIIGYLIGSFSNAILVSRLFGLGDIRKKGSGNAGATNVLRNHGKKFGAIVFILDFMKTVVASLLAMIVKENVIIPAVGVAVVIGHIYPIFFGFKGGKGAACLFGLFLSINWFIAVLGIFVFFTVLKLTKMVSVCSIMSPIILIIIYATTVMTNAPLADKWAMPIVHGEELFIPLICLIAAHVLVICKHKANIQRIFAGKENKLKF